MTQRRDIRSHGGDRTKRIAHGTLSTLVARGDSTARITLRNLVTARWVLLSLLALTGLILALDVEQLGELSSWLPPRPPASAFFAVLGVWAAANVATDRLILQRDRATAAHAGVHLLIDAAVITALLGLSGGATNAFTTLYFIPITLATQVSPRWTWTLAGSCLAGFAALFLMHPIPQGPPGHEAHFAGHLRGMWVAFAVSGTLITFFVHRTAISLARQRTELARLRDQAFETRHLGALGGLAAGAAHELGSPLGSIELLTGELEAMETTERSEAIETMRGEILRCKTILQRMASPELRVSALGRKGGEPWLLSGLGAELANDHPVHVDDRADGVRTTLPRAVVTQILRELVANADAAAAGSESDVTVSVSATPSHAEVSVRDRSGGMPSDVLERAFHPFFSGKPEGEGMGLGLYLARAQARELGGTLSLQTVEGEGTTVWLKLPLEPSLTTLS